jgi:hypothetical protein
MATSLNRCVLCNSTTTPLKEDRIGANTSTTTLNGGASYTLISRCCGAKARKTLSGRFCYNCNTPFVGRRVKLNSFGFISSSNIISGVGAV